MRRVAKCIGHPKSKFGRGIKNLSNPKGEDRRGERTPIIEVVSESKVSLAYEKKIPERSQRRITKRMRFGDK